MKVLSGLIGIAAIVAALVFVALNRARYETPQMGACRKDQAIWIAMDAMKHLDHNTTMMMRDVLETVMYGIDCTYVAYRDVADKDGYVYKQEFGPIKPDELYKLADITTGIFFESAFKAVKQYPGGVTLVVLSRDNVANEEPMPPEMKRQVATVLESMNSYLVPMTTEKWQNVTWLENVLLNVMTGAKVVTLKEMHSATNPPLATAIAYAELEGITPGKAAVFGSLLRDYLNRELFYGWSERALYEMVNTFIVLFNPKRMIV